MNFNYKTNLRSSTMKRVGAFTELSRKPYRGILKEVAAERGVTPQAVHMAINHYDDIEVIAIARAKMRKRERQYQSAIDNIAV